jgi:hypothetical protein
MDFAAHSWPLFFACFAAGYLLGRRARRRPDPTPQPLRTDISDADIESAVRAGRTIDAIRLYRQRGGAGLVEAKAAVDAMARRLGA